MNGKLRGFATTMCGASVLLREDLSSWLCRLHRKPFFYGILMMQCTPPASRGNLFIKGFDQRQQTADASGRWRLVCVGSVCTPNKLFAVLPSGNRALLPHSSTRLTVTLARPLFVDERMVETQSKPHQCFGSFCHMLVMGCVVSRPYNRIYFSCLVANWW